jgi:predicted DNA-binding transcriptional regulator AlpA
MQCNQGDVMQQTYKREEMIKVAKIAQRWGVCRQHIYNLIDKGHLAPAFRFGGRQGICVPLPVITAFEQSSQIDPGK